MVRSSSAGESPIASEALGASLNITKRGGVHSRRSAVIQGGASPTVPGMVQASDLD